jgi:hypothetical protein
MPLSRTVAPYPSTQVPPSTFGRFWAQAASRFFIPVTNPRERLHKEIKRPTRVVGIFPNRDSLMRMVATLLAEQDDEWQVMDRRYFSLGSMAKLDALEGGEDPKKRLIHLPEGSRPTREHPGQASRNR